MLSFWRQVVVSAEAGKYAEAVKLLAECMYCSVFTVERLKVCLCDTGLGQASRPVGRSARLLAR